MNTLSQHGKDFWLIKHELRLAWRTLNLSGKAFIIGVILYFVYFIFGFVLAYWLIDEEIAPSTYYSISIFLSALGLFTFNLSSSMTASQRILYESGDLELLLTSPILPRHVIMTKLSSIVVSTIILDAALIFPILIPIALLGHPALFGLIGLICAIAIISTCLGLGIAILIMRVSGPLAARKLIQIFAAIMGAAMFILSQLVAHLGNDTETTSARIYNWCVTHGIGTAGVSSLAGKMAFGDPIAFVITFGGSLIVLGFTAWSLQTQFLQGYQSAAEKFSTRKKSFKSLGRHFSNNLAFVMARKEAMLLLRDPALIFHMLMRIIYIGPMVFLLLKFSDTTLISTTKLSGAAFLSVFLAGQLMGEIASLTIHGEDAPDLLATSPHSAKLLIWWKLLAAGVIGLPIMLLIPILLATISAPIATATLLLTLLAGGIAAAIELKLSKPIPRSKFVTRSSGSWVASILTLLISASLGAANSYLAYVMT